MSSVVEIDALAARAYADRIEAAARDLADHRGSLPHHVCVIGAGQMGIGIATALLQAELPVTLVDQDAARTAGAADRIRRNWQGQLARGKLTQAQVDDRMARFSATASLADAAGADLFIEAVWEDLALKQRIFADLARIAGADAILATNTSTLDIDAIADAASRPERVVGLHFFNPAHVMRLLEIVRGTRTGERALALASALAARLGKVPVVVGNCYGFVGNRIFAARDAQNVALLIAGADPEQIDAAMTAFGFPMGPFTLQDMAGGIELTWRLRQASGAADPIGDALYEQGRLGLQCGRGYYRYEPGDRTPHPDPDVHAIIETARRQANVERRVLPEEEIVDRMVLPMINEAARILAEAIVTRASDIDLVWNAGFGWPRDKGGITWFADRLGAGPIVARLRELASVHGDHFAPAPLLVDMARRGQGFAALDQPIGEAQLSD